MSAHSWVAVGSGAATGAWLRWRFGILLNHLFPTIPLGTLAANLLAGFLIGVSAELFSQFTTIAPEVRLLVITGFLGGLSTFSTFSAEVVTLIERTEYLWAVATISIHVLGSLLMTFAGIVIVRFILSAEGL